MRNYPLLLLKEFGYYTPITAASALREAFAQAFVLAVSQLVKGPPAVAENPVMPPKPSETRIVQVTLHLGTSFSFLVFLSLPIISSDRILAKTKLCIVKLGLKKCNRNN